VLLEVRDAGRVFHRRQVFSGLELAVTGNESVMLDGANGSGKSTLLRCLAGTLELTTGSVHVQGWAAGSMQARADTGLCLHPESGLAQRISGHQNLLFAARLRLPPPQVADAVEGLEEELGLMPFRHQRVRHYSSGMRALVVIARALLGTPALLLLDEPTRSLDTEARQRVWAAMDRRSAGVVIASHRETDRERCDRTFRMPVLA